MPQKDFDSRITVLDSVREPASKTYQNATIADVLSMIRDKRYANLEKLRRPCVCTSANNQRPVGSNALDIWAGFQVIDLDIHDQKIAELIRTVIGWMLRGRPWFIASTLSSSHQGVHIYTMVEPPAPELPRDVRQQYYDTNFRNKYAWVFDSLLSVVEPILPEIKGKNGEQLFETAEQALIAWIDMAMSKPAQVAIIPYDPDIVLNPGFQVEPLGDPVCPSYESDAVMRVFAAKTRTEKDSKNNEDKPGKNIQIGIEINDVIPGEAGEPRHYAYVFKYHIVNTLIAQYGLEEGTRRVFGVISTRSEKGEDITRELYGMCASAARHSRPASELGITVLQKYHGYKFDYKKTGIIPGDKKVKELGDIELPSMRGILPSFDNPIILEEGQYIGSVAEQVTKRLVTGRVNLIIAGPGTGKTEYIKRLAKEHRTMLIEPFTSTIKSKIESEGEIDWVCMYHNKNNKLKVYDLTGTGEPLWRLSQDPKIGELFKEWGIDPKYEDKGVSNKNICITPDGCLKRFDTLNIQDLALEYLVIDESHLLYTSSYREVMPRFVSYIKKLTTSLPNTKIILMTGTPMGEDKFNKDANIIPIRRRDDSRIKTFGIRVYKDRGEMRDELVRDMARDINDGLKVLYPTNNGASTCREIGAAVSRILKDDYGWTRKVKVCSYRKSAAESKEVQLINERATIGENDLIVCTSYLSVGVDIKDKYKFRIYFTEAHLPGEIDQWCNRLRENDLVASLYTYKQDANGNDTVFCRAMTPYEFNHDTVVNNAYEGALACAHVINNMAQNYHDFLTGNKESDIRRLESKVDPGSFSDLCALRSPYIKFSEDRNGYVVDEDAFRLGYWEDRLRDYFMHYPCLLSGMREYGYVITYEDLTHEKDSTEKGDCVEQQSKEDTKVSVKESKVTPSQLAEERRKGKKEYQMECTGLIEECLELVRDENLESLSDALRCKNGVEVRSGADEFRKVWGPENTVIYEVKDLDVFEKVMPLVVRLSTFLRASDIKNVFESSRMKSGAYNFAEIRRIGLMTSIRGKEGSILQLRDLKNTQYERLEELGVRIVTEIDRVGDGSHKRMRRDERGNAYLAGCDYENLLDDMTKLIWPCDKKDRLACARKDEYGNLNFAYMIRSTIDDMFKALLVFKKHDGLIRFRIREAKDYISSEPAWDPDLSAYGYSDVLRGFIGSEQMPIPRQMSSDLSGANEQQIPCSWDLTEDPAQTPIQEDPLMEAP